MICFPNAKINLGLSVISKRNDGYHNIETIFYPIPLYDILEIIPSSKDFSFETTGLIIPENPHNNLCIKAYNILKLKHNIPPVKIFLHKNIPTGSGLGGGSSNASFTLTTLNKLFNLNLPESKIASYAGLIGSDCPFFIYNNPSYATGKGEILNPIDISFENYFIVIIKPPLSINTSQAYSLINPHNPTLKPHEIAKKPIESWKNNLINDFEKVFINKYPVITEIIESLYDLNAIYASMSGSGSSVFGLFKNKPNLITDIYKDCFIWTSKL